MALGALALSVPPAGRPAEPSHTLSLDECVAIAVEGHPILGAAGAEVRAAEFRVSESISPMLPHANAQYEPTRKKRTLAALIEGPSTDLTSTVESTFTFQTARFALSQLLMDFGRTLNQWRAALADVESAQALQGGARQTVIFGVRRSYYELVAAGRLLGVAEETLTRARQHLDAARSRWDSGLAPRFDVITQEAQEARAELAVVTAEDNVTLARENLRSAMGVDEPIAFQVDDTALDYAPLEVDEATVLAQAYAGRAELVSVAALKRAQERRIQALFQQYLPVALGRADYTLTGERPGDEGWFIGAFLSFSLFDGGRTPSQIGEAKAKLRQLEAEERKTRQEITLEVRQALVRLRHGEKSLAVSEKVVRAAEEMMRVADTRYRSGVGSILELSDAQVSLAAARGGRVTLLADHRVARAQLDRAVGRTLSE